MRFAQKASSKGSQKYIQWLVNDTRDLLGGDIRERLSLAPDAHLQWLSPLAADDYAEYRDAEFLSLLGLSEQTLRHSLADFWPRGGPQWDGLARTSTGKVILIEAKSYLREMRSSCKATSKESLKRIRSSLDLTRQYFNSTSDIGNWLNGYYQYANRLAHLYWLREINGIEADLIFVYFINDKGQRGPTSSDGWHSEINLAHRTLDLSEQSLQNRHVHDLFFDVDRCGA